MSRKKYSLEVLRELRHRQVDEQALRVTEQARKAERAKAAHAASQKARQAEQERTAQTLSDERSLLEQGELKARDLAQAEVFRRASAARVEKLAGRERKAAAELLDAVQKEGAARGELAQKDSAAKLMDQHRKDWQDADARSQERAEEEAILDQWTLKRHGRKRV